MTLKPTYHRWIFLGSLSLIAIGLPLSKAFVSIGGLVLAANFLLDFDFETRLQQLKKHKVILGLWLGVFFMHLIGLLWTENISRGIDDLRIKLPLILFPVVLSLSKPPSLKEYRIIITLFIIGVLLASIPSTIHWFEIKDDPGADFRTIARFTSHIRYALMVCLAFLFLLNFAWNSKSNKWRLLYILGAIWLSVFIFILQSLTGILTWLLCGYFLLIYTLAYIKAQRIKTVALTVLTVTPLLVGSYLIFQVDAFYPDEEPVFQSLETHSAGGESYKHDTLNLSLENGNYINFYLAYHELEVEWNKRSDIPFWGGLDNSDQLVNATLIRYLTSKGLRKDSVGVNALTEDDVKAIEKGIANVRFTYGNPIDNRVYTVIWEFDRMMTEKRVQGHSVAQRFAFWRTGWLIFKENIWYGVGTGDVSDAFNAMYDRTDSKLSDKYRLRAHNQYLTLGITFGVFGMLLFIISIFYPFFFMRKANTFRFIGFSIVLLASMLVEDTLETQVGVTIYAFFNTLLLFSAHSIVDDEEPSTSS